MKENKEINVAVVGLGVGLHHAKFYLNEKRANLKYLIDFDKKKRELARKLFPRANIFKSFDELSDIANLDAISIASYDNYHFDQIIKSIDRNLNVFIEKPICQTKSELNLIYSHYKKNNIVMRSNFPLRTTPRFIDLKSDLRNKVFGNILSLNLNYFWGRKEKLLYGWRREIDNYSIIQGGMIHMLDLAYFLLEEWPTEVMGASSNKGFKEYEDSEKKSLYDNAFVILKYKDGKIVNCRVDALSCYPHFHEVHIHGTEKSYISTISKSFYVNSSKEQNLDITLHNAAYPSRENRYKLIENFLNDIINKQFKIDYYLYNLMNLVFVCEDAVKNSTSIPFKFKYYE